MNERKFQSTRGVTLFETLIIALVVLIVAAMLWPLSGTRARPHPVRVQRLNRSAIGVLPSAFDSARKESREEGRAALQFGQGGPRNLPTSLPVVRSQASP